jgi:hypothetical protein
MTTHPSQPGEQQFGPNDLAFLRRYSVIKGGLPPLDNLLAAHAQSQARIEQLEKLLARYDDAAMEVADASAEGERRRILRAQSDLELVCIAVRRALSLLSATANPESK